MKVIINNDDLALTYGTTKGITRCFRKGITTSTSIIVNGSSFEYSVKSLIRGDLRGIGFGIHLNLTDGVAFEKKLADRRGNYKFSFISLLKEVTVNKNILKIIGRDLEAQIQKLLSTGLKIDHIDSDKHVHMIPDIFEITCKLAVKYKIPYIRTTREPLYFSESNFLYPIYSLNIFKNLILNYFSGINIHTASKYHLSFTDAVYGVLYSDQMSINSFKSAVENAQSHNFRTVEILSHPGVTQDPKDKHFISPLMKEYSQEKNRELEMYALLDKELKYFLKTNNISLVKFPELAKQQGQSLTQI